MKNTIKLAVIGALLAAAILPAAATTASAPKTNYDLTINFSLTAYTTGISTPASITSKQVIQGLNGTTNTLGKANQFSTAAKLVFRQVLSGSNVMSTGQFVLDGTGTNATTTDVSAYVNRTPTFTAAVTNGNSFRYYSSDRFQVVPGAPALHLEGVSTITTTVLSASKATVLHSLSMQAAGIGVTGSGEGAITNVVSGTITYSSGRLE